MYQIDTTLEQRDLDEAIRRTAGLEAVRGRILASNEVTVKDLMEIERLSPGSVYQNDTLRTAGLCGISDEVQVHAALEAINWSSAGGKGIIAAIIAVILVILRNVAGMLLRYLQRRRVTKNFEDIGYRLKKLYESIDESLCNFFVAPRYVDSVINSDGEFHRSLYESGLRPISIVEAIDSSIQSLVQEANYSLENLQDEVFSRQADERFLRLSSVNLVRIISIRTLTDRSVTELSKKAEPNDVSKYESMYKNAETIQAMMDIFKKLKDNLYMTAKEVGQVKDLLIDFRESVNLEEYSNQMESFPADKQAYVNYFVGLAFQYADYSQSFKADMTEHLNRDKKTQSDLIAINKTVEEMDKKILGYGQEIQTAYIGHKKHVSDVLSFVNLLTEINAKMVMACVKFDSVFA